MTQSMICERSRRPHSRAAPDILILGHLGAGNLGDELMLRGLLHLAAGEGISAVVLRSRATDWMDPRSMADGEVATARRFSMSRVSNLRVPVLLCGGTTFHDADAGQAPARNAVAMTLLAAQLLAPKLARSRFHLVAVGIGPIHRRWTRAITTSVAHTAASVTVRDEPSRECLARFGRAAMPIVEDLATHAPELNTLAKEPPTEINRVGIVPVPHPTRAGESIPSASQLEPILRELGPVDITILPFNRTGRNLASARHLAAILRCRLSLPTAGADAVGQVLQVLAAQDLVISARFHGALAAASMGAPVIGVSYHPKVRNLAHSEGFPLLDDDRPAATVLGQAVNAARARADSHPSRALRDQVVEAAQHQL